MSVMNMPPAKEVTATPPRIKRRHKLEPEEGSRLSMLMTQLPALEAAKAEAESKLKEHKKAIQLEIGKTVSDPDNMPDVFDIPADPYGGYPAYTLSAREGAWRLNSEALKTQEPGTYERYLEQGQPYWELKRRDRNRVKRGSLRSSTSNRVWVLHAYS